MSDTVYLTPDEWEAMSTGIDLTDLSTDQKTAIIATASLIAEAFSGLPLGGSWLVQSYTNEQHRWRPNSRRVYLHNGPIVSIDEVRMRVGAGTSATIQGSEIYVNNTGGYIEVSSLALAFGIAPDIVSLGLSEPEVEVDYTAGYDTIPTDLKTGVAIIACAQVINKKLLEEGSGGAVSFTVGSYMVSYAMRGSGTQQLGGLAGFSNTVPEAARLLLRSYSRTPYLR